MKEKGIIFDFNGTLLWDTMLHNQAWDIFLKQYGFTLTEEEKQKRIHGRLNREIILDLFADNYSGDKLTVEAAEQFGLEKEAIYRELCHDLPDFSLANGVVALFEHLREANIPFVIATASGYENVSFYIQELKLLNWFQEDHLIYSDGTMRGKPFPDLFLKAIGVLGIRAEDTIIFEDSPSGIKAAEAAGAGKIVIVNSADSDYSEWEGKHSIIHSFNEFVWE